MSTPATSNFEVQSWDERTYQEIDGGARLTRASVTKSFQGEIEGESTLEYLMMYRADGSADFVGLERVIGHIGDRAGSFVLQHSGTFAGGTARGALRVVPGSGTGDLQGLQGEGDFVAGHEPPGSMTLAYDLAQ